MHHDSHVCPACGEGNVPARVQHGREHFHCRDCRQGWSRPAPPPPAPRASR